MFVRVFLFEYAACVGCESESIAVEGLGMFNALYKGFSSFSEVVSAQSLELEEIIEKADYSLVIAPEDDFLLYNLTKKIKDGNLGSKPAGVAIASDKWLTYQAIKRKANTPKTSLKLLEPPFVVKPRVSCGGSGISLHSKLPEEMSDEMPEGYIAQEYVRGRSFSVSLMVGDDVNVLSVNEQLMQGFEYAGSITPCDCNAEVSEEAIKAVEAIKGLFGYVGIDLVLAEQPYVVDVNPRVTTSAILLDEAYGINLAELMVRNYEGRKIPELKPRRKLILRKVRAEEANFVKVGGYGLRVEVEGHG